MLTPLDPQHRRVQPWGSPAPQGLNRLVLGALPGRSGSPHPHWMWLFACVLRDQPAGAWSHCSLVAFETRQATSQPLEPPAQCPCVPALRPCLASSPAVSLVRPVPYGLCNSSSPWQPGGKQVGGKAAASLHCPNPAEVPMALRPSTGSTPRRRPWPSPTRLTSGWQVGAVCALRRVSALCVLTRGRVLPTGSCSGGAAGGCSRCVVAPAPGTVSGALGWKGQIPFLLLLFRSRAGWSVGRKGQSH